MTHGTNLDLADLAASGAPRPRYRRFLSVGFGSGALAGLCCVGSAIAVGVGLSGLAFFSTWMNRYQIYFILAGIAIMATWLIGEARRVRGGAGAKHALRGIARQALVMGAVFAVTLGITAAAAGIAAM